MFVVFKERLSQKSDRLPLRSHLSALSLVPIFTLQRSWESRCEYLAFLPLVGHKSLPAKKGKQDSGVGDLLLRKQ